jgi:hypothetical protein
MNHLYLSFTCALPWTCVLLVLFNEVFYFLQNSVTYKFIPCQAHFAQLWVLNSTVIRLQYSNILWNIRFPNYFSCFWPKNLLKIIPLRSKFRKCALYALRSMLYAHALATLHRAISAKFEQCLVCIHSKQPIVILTIHNFWAWNLQV